MCLRGTAGVATLHLAQLSVRRGATQAQKCYPDDTNAPYIFLGLLGKLCSDVQNITKAWSAKYLDMDPHDT